MKSNLHLDQLLDRFLGDQCSAPLRLLVKELATRELQRLNPHSDFDPCVFEGEAGMSCIWGTYGCSKDHLSEPLGKKRST